MAVIEIPIGRLDDDYLSQLEYALAFASQDIVSHSFDKDVGRLTVELRPGADQAAVRRKIEQLLERFTRSEFGLKSTVHFRQERELPVFDAYQDLLDRRWITPVGVGHVILRGMAAQLRHLIHMRINRVFVSEFNAEWEYYPATIQCRTLDRLNHFSSFPQHVDFVAHLREDVDELSAFAARCREGGWSQELHHDRMADVDYAISPSCCYHCYEGMEGWDLEPPGRCTTMMLGCHRYEGANLRSLSRLRAFTQRDVVWVGHPKFVTNSRRRAEELIIDWAKEWQLDCTFETANDMFFTDDYAVKASFQRQQEAKRELRMRIPFENKTISVFSSNFHAATFAKAFGITVKGRTATSACVGWGYERWVYAIFSQFGLDPNKWPATLRAEFDEYVAGRPDDAR